MILERSLGAEAFHSFVSQLIECNCSQVNCMYPLIFQAYHLCVTVGLNLWICTIHGSRCAIYGSLLRGRVVKGVGHLNHF